MQLTPHFTLGEFTTSATGSRKGIANIPNDIHLGNIKLVANQLELIRPYTGPIVLLSGFRCLALNRAVGGSKTSAHVDGLAADIHAPLIGNHLLAEICAKHIPDFDQIILEFPSKTDIHAGWVHLGFRPKGPRRQKMTAKKDHGQTIYIPGFQP